MIWLLIATAPASAADTWKVDGNDSTVYAQLHLEDTQTAKLTGFLDHAVRLGLVDGTVTTDGDTVTAAKVEGVVASLKPGDAVLRKLAGFAGNQTEAQATQLQDCVFNQLQPEVDNTVSFEAKSAEGTLADLKVTGTFKLHGVSKELVVPLKIVADGDGMRATGTVEIHLPDYEFRIPEESVWTVKEKATLVLDLGLEK